MNSNLKHKMFLIVAALVLLFVQSAFAQTDPEVLWTYGDSTVGYSSNPVVHPNGNVLIGDRVNEDVIELNGLTGEIVRRIPIAIPDHSGETIEVSKDGTRLVMCGKILDYQTGEIIKDSLPSPYLLFLHPFNDKFLYIDTGYRVAIYDLNKSTYNSIQLPHSITAFCVSSDGKYLAIACKDFIKTHDKTYFYLYNAQTMQHIRDLEITESKGRVIEFIQFSENSKYVGYGQLVGGEPKATFFQCEEPFKKWEVNKQDTPPYGMHSIGFIKDDYVFMSQYFNEKSVGIIWNINTEKEIYRTELYSSSLPVYNKVNNSILVWSSLNYNLVSLNLSNIFSDVSVNDQKNLSPKFTTEYSNGILSISNYISTTGNVNIQIVDIKGNTVFSIIHHIVIGNDKIELPLNLSEGVYILQLQDGKKEYSSKFLVTE